MQDLIADITSQYEGLSQRPLKISLDYDKTFTAAPDLWTMLVVNAKNLGHDIRFVTFRHKNPIIENKDIETDARKLDIPIIYSEYRPKRIAWDADIWIDDMPELIPVNLIT